MISEIYCELRKTSTQKTLPITPRTLETLIRLSSAHAKIRMSNEVTEDDVSVIFKILEYALTFTTKTGVPTLPPQTNKRKETDRAIEPSSKRDKLVEEETVSENDRKERIKTKMVQMFRDSRGESIEVEDLRKEVSKGYKYTDQEFEAIVDAILEANDAQFMREGPTIYRL
jgi:DNA replication licensing factor MCM3